MQDEPTAGELLESIRELLTEEILPVIDEEVLRFRIRVALNALGILERELEIGPAALAGERQRLQALGFTNDPMADLAEDDSNNTSISREVRNLNRQLAAHIRQHGSAPELFDHLLQTELERLAIASPKSLARILEDLEPDDIALAT